MTTTQPDHRLSVGVPDGAPQTEAERSGDLQAGREIAGATGLVEEAVAAILESKAAQTPLDEAGRAKVAKLFNSPTAGYESYALSMLREQAKIDPYNLSKGSAQFWASPEAALKELQDNLTAEQLAVIEAEMNDPAIVIEPIVAHSIVSHSEVFVKDDSGGGVVCSVIGNTPFRVSYWMKTQLNRQDEKAGITTATGGKIIGWRIGIAEKGKPKILTTDGDVSKKLLKDRANDFHEKGYGKLHFKSIMDYPVLYGTMMADSRIKDPKNPMDNLWGTADERSTMSTEVDDDQGLFVAVGFWSPVTEAAHLHECVAVFPFGQIRIRLVLMFTKSQQTQNNSPH